MNTTRPNDHILEYLRYYCDKGNSFDYAVLITGPWGAGKTYFIKKFIEQLAIEHGDRKSFRALYVSLNGITSPNEIDDELFRQLHPVLASKPMKIGWGILKGALKGALKIDIAAKEELSINSTLPDVDELAGVLKTPPDALLIFDDLERCAMPLPEVLGYINGFVEHNSYKAIIIANEAEMLAREIDEAKTDDGTEKDRTGQKVSSAAKKYSLIKEKLIGQTLELRSSAEDALDDFLSAFNNDSAKSFLRKNRETILDIHSRSLTGNLRLLKHALWDYERLSRAFLDTHWKNDAAMCELLKVTFVLAIEVRAGRLRRDVVAELSMSTMVRLMRKRLSNGGVGLASEIADRYPMVEMSTSPLALDALSCLLFEGWLGIDRVRECLDQSSYYSNKHEPPWLIAWKGWEVSDTEFSMALNEVERQFQQREFASNFELLHVIGLRIFFSEIEAIDYEVEEVVQQGMKCLDDLMAANRIEEVDISELFRVGQVYCLGYQVMCSETTEFQRLFHRFEALVSEVKLAKLPTHGQKLLDHMRDDPLMFSHLICTNSIRDAIYWDVPVLATIPVDQFADRLLALSSEGQRMVFAALKGRYGAGTLAGELQAERIWLAELSRELTARASKLAPLSRFRTNERVKQNLAPFLNVGSSSVVS